MMVSRDDFEAAVRVIKAAANYAGVDTALLNSSGGDHEDHYIIQDGQRMRVASGDHQRGLYVIEDFILPRVLPSEGQQREVLLLKPGSPSKSPV